MPLPARVPGAAVTPPAVFYLHGFASSPRSTKAAYFAERLLRFGIVLRSPDFNEPDFRTLTITRMLDRLERDLAGAHGKATLIGSSLGGTVAILGAERFGGTIERLVLLAPAVMFASPGHHLLPPERVAEWRRQGALPFFHYGEGRERLLDVAFYEDSLRYDPFHAVVEQPALVFQGLHDESVDYRTVEQFAAARPNVALTLLDDDHQLAASLPRMWEGAAKFLDLA